MQRLEQLGMNRNWIYEVIVSTYYENNPHSAPIGVWTDDFDALHMEIYKSTKTVKSIIESREFTVNLVSDLKVFYESLFHKANIAYEKSARINAPVIKGVPSFIESRIKSIEEKELVFHLESAPVHMQNNGPITLINRAEALALESLILATKYHHLAGQKTIESLKENYRVIKKVAPGSQYETILESLFDRLQAGSKSM